MQNETHYYLLNGKVMKGGEMPERRIVQHKDYNQKFEDSKFKMFYENWLSSLQPCDIDESELDKIKDYFKNIDFWDESKIADITELLIVVNESYTHNGNMLGKCAKIYLKQPTEKQVEYINLEKLSELFFAEASSGKFGKITDNNWTKIFIWFSKYLQPKQVGSEAVYTEKQVDELIETICDRLRSGFFKSLELKRMSIDRIRNEDYKHWKNEIFKNR